MDGDYKSPFCRPDFSVDGVTIPFLKNLPNDSGITYLSKHFTVNEELVKTGRKPSEYFNTWKRLMLKRKYSVNTEFFKLCPSCCRKLFYYSKWSLIKSIKECSICKSCSKTNELNPNYRRKQSKKEKEKRNSKLRTKKRFLKSKIKYSLSKLGTNNPQYNNHEKKSTEHRRKIRLSCIKRIQEKLGKKRLAPRFSVRACDFIEKYGNENDYTFQHTLNGGEYYIKELGYWIDGYDKNKNVVIEYDEYNHWHRNNQKRDEERRKEIVDFLKCKFILIKEGIGNQHGISEYLYK